MSSSCQLNDGYFKRLQLPDFKKAVLQKSNKQQILEIAEITVLQKDIPDKGGAEIHLLANQLM